MQTQLIVNGFGSEWTDFHSDYYCGKSLKMFDYHMHSYYELSIIISGNVKILLPNGAFNKKGAKLFLAAPMTPHFVLPDGVDTYERINLLFSEEYAAKSPDERSMLYSLFGSNGRVIELSIDNAERLVSLAKQITEEESSYRRSLLLRLLLSLASELLDNGKEESNLPKYIPKAIKYLQECYSEKIVAGELAWKLGIGRTTLMTSFKLYTGVTLGEYLTGIRVSHAVEYLRGGDAYEIVARKCGLGDSCNLIRIFKRMYGVTPKEYMKRRLYEKEL